MKWIRVRESAGRTKYQAIVRRPDHTTVSRTFRRLEDARTWALREERKTTIPDEAPPAMDRNP